MPDAPREAEPTKGQRPRLRGYFEPWMLSQFMVGLVSGAAFLLPSLVIDRGGTPAQVGLLLAIIPALILATPLLGALLDRYHTYRLFHAIGLISIAAGIAVLGFSYGPTGWYLGGIITSLGLPFVFITNLTLVMGGGFTEDEAAKRIAVVQLLFALGQAIVLLVVGALTAVGTPFEVIYASLAGVAAAGFIVTTATNRAAARRAGAVADEARATKAAAAAAAPKGRGRLRGAMTLPFAVFISCVFLTFLGFSSFDSQYPIFLDYVFGVAVSVSSATTGIALLIALLMYPVAAAWVARSGPRGAFLTNLLVRFLAAAGTVALSAVAGGGGTLVILLYSSVMVVWPFMDVSSPVLASETTPLGAGVAQGAYTFAIGLGIIVGPIVGGLIAQIVGFPALPIAFLLGNLVALILAFFGLRMKSRARARPQAAAA